MARKIVNRKELRDQAEAAEKMEAAAPAGEAKKKAPAKPRKSRAKKDAAPVREKLFWAVFNQAGKRIALFEYSQKKSAEKKAQELSTSSKTQHYVARHKEAIAEG